MLAIRKNLKISLMSFIDDFKIDDKGAFVLPFELRLKDQEFLKYCHLDVDWDIPSISSEDLPDEFCQKAVKLVDLFRRKTAHLPYECMLFFDYRREKSYIVLLRIILMEELGKKYMKFILKVKM